MPKSDDPKIPVSKDTRKRLNIYKANNDFKSMDEAIGYMLDKLEKKEVKND